MDAETRLDALHAMIAAQGLLIEHMWANTLAQWPDDEAERVKAAIIDGSGNAIEAYTGGPIDVKEIQSFGQAVQDHMRAMIESISRREAHARNVRSQDPSG